MERTGAVEIRTVSLGHAAGDMGYEGDADCSNRRIMVRPMRELKRGETRSRDSPRSADRFRYCVRQCTAVSGFSRLIQPTIAYCLNKEQRVYGCGKDLNR